MAKRLTANDGASRTRSEINRKLKAILRRQLSEAQKAPLLELALFIAGMALRAGKKKGGLGKH